MVLPAVVLASSGVLILVGSVVGARYPTIHPLEQRVFRVINRLPGALYWVLWLPMQLGNLVVGTLAGLAIAALLGDLGLAIAVVAAMALKLFAERWARHRMAPYLTVRQRPGTSEPGAVLRGDVPSSGPSFPSGHVILVVAIACVLTTGLEAELVWVPWAAAALVGIGRVYVGAHNPLDVTAGLGLGMVVGGALAIPLGL